MTSSRTLAVVVLASAAGALAPAAANAKLIPPAGPWPTNVIGAANPLTGTPFVYNGGFATGNASLRVWLPVRGKRRSAVTRTIGGRTIVRGRLRNRDNHRSISGATVTLATQSVYGGPWYAVGNFRTNRKGRFRAVLLPGHHRRTAVLYYPAVNWSSPLFSRRLLVRAKSRVWLGKPYRSSRRRVRIDGKISGAAVPSTGLLVLFEVRNRRGNWVTPRVARTRPTGRFRIRYRFPGPGRFAVRVRVPSQTGWSLYGNTSKSRRVRPRR
jgi:hypothetical protein